MKKQLLFIACALILSNFSNAQINLDSGLVGFFMLDANVADSSNTALNGTATNLSYTTGVNGIANTAGSFNGFSTYVSAGTNNRTITNHLTVCAWVKTSTYGRVIEKYRWQDNKGFLLAVSTLGKARLAGRNGTSIYYTTGNVGPTITDNQWHFLFGVIEGNSWKIWVDNIIIDSVTSTTFTPQLDNSNPLTIGKYHTNNNFHFNGDIDQVRLYNRVLNSAERTKLYEDGLWTIDTVAVATCDSFLWAPSGLTYYQSGLYFDTLTGANGFDSISVLDLTLTHSTVATVSESTCGSYTAPDGVIYSVTGNYSAVIPNSVGCDSVITINLTMGNSTSSIINEVACDSYTAPDGQSYTASGVYSIVIPNSSGCDSVITLNLTVNSSTSSSITTNSCGPYTAPDGMIYSVTGNYTAIIPSTAGCDSVISINLSVSDIDTSLTVNGNEIDAVDDPSYIYQWVNCYLNVAMPGETNSTFDASQSGSYQVIISNGNCVDTSGCVSIIIDDIEEFDASSIIVYPNPAKQLIWVAGLNGKSKVSVLDLNGVQLFFKETTHSEVQIDLSKWTKGVYVLHVSENQHPYVKKIVVE